jgi:chromosomal replication initiator protein
MITAMRGDQHIPTRRPMVSEIIRAVADHFGLTVGDILSQRRERRISRPRQIAMYLARENSGKSTTQLGREFERDHTTVVYATQVIAKEIDSDPIMAREMERIMAGVLRRVT